MGMAHEGDAVLRAPAGQAGVVHLLLPLQDQAAIEGGIGVLLAVKQGQEAVQMPASRREDLRKAPCPGHHIPHVAAQHAGLIGEKADDDVAEILGKMPVIGLMGQLDEALHCLRVQDIGAEGRIRFPIVLAVVHAPDGAAAVPFHQIQAVLFAQHPVPHAYFLHARKAQAGQVRPVFHHLAAGGAGGIHALVVQHHPHIQFRRRFDGGAQIIKEGLGQIADILPQPHAGMKHHAVNAVIAKIPQLAADLPVGQIAVQEPEGNGRIFPGWMIQFVKSPHGQQPPLHSLRTL